MAHTPNPAQDDDEPICQTCEGLENYCECVDDSVERQTYIRFSYSQKGRMLKVWAWGQKPTKHEERDDDEHEDFVDVCVVGPENDDFDPVHEHSNIKMRTRIRSGIRFFDSMVASDIFGEGAGWNLFLSMYLPDEVIDVIYSTVDEWSHLTEPDDLIQKAFTQFTSGVCVDDDGVVTI